MPYPFPQAGLFFQNGNGIVAALYRAAIDPVVDYAAGGAGGDDSSALRAALSASQSTGIPVYLPSYLSSGARAVFGISSPIDIPPGASLIGDATALTTGPTLRALAPMAYMLGCKGNSFFTPTGPQPPLLSGFNLDGRGKAVDGVQLQGSWLQRGNRRVGVTGTTRTAWRAMGHSVGVTFSALSGPSSFSVSLRDIGYNALFGFVTPFALKCVTPGGFGTATFVLSTTGAGGPYNTATQLFAQTLNVVLTSASSYLYDSGVEVTFPSRTFAANEIYSFTATPLSEPGISDNGTSLNNAEFTLDDSWTYSIGSVYASSGLFGTYASGFNNAFTSPGTASVTSASPIVRGSGTAFLTGTVARPGDFFFATGMTRPVAIACVLDDAGLLLAAGDLPSITASGLDYAIGCGASVWQEDSADNARWEIARCRLNGNPVAVRAAGNTDGGIGVTSCRLENRLFYDITVGGLLNSEKGFLLVRVEHKASIANSHAMYLGPKAAGGTIIEPLQDGASLSSIVGPGSAPTVIINGVIGSH